MRKIDLMLIFLLISCSKESKFPTEKRFWTPEDYKNAVLEIEYATPEGEEYPRFSNPVTSVVIRKLVDHQNYEVILNDSELGLKHKDDVSQLFFDEYQKLSNVYRVTDIQDKYIYADELVEIEKFGLGLQLRYFKLGNDRILEGADNPEALRITNAIEHNEGTIVRNFTLYLDGMNDEKNYSESSLAAYAEGLTIYFNGLLETFPKANFDPILKKSILMDKKVKSTAVKSALEELIAKLESIKKIKEGNAEITP